MHAYKKKDAVCYDVTCMFTCLIRCPVHRLFALNPIQDG